MDRQQLRRGFFIVIAGVLAGLLLTAMIGRLNASASAGLSLGTSVIPEGDDFATRVLGQPWDMNGDPYPDIKTTFWNIDRNSFNQVNGAWSLQATSSDPALWLHWTGINNTQKVLKLGDRFPIETNKYELLSFHMCTGQDTLANLYWFYDRSPHNNPNNGISQFLPIQSGCRVYVIDLNNFPTFSGTWSGKPLGLRLDPAMEPISFEIGWVRLTSKDLSNIVPISWNSVSPGSELEFYASPTACAASDRILVGTTTAGSASGTFSWGSSLQTARISGVDYNLPLPESLEPGLYHIFMKDLSTGDFSCSSSQLEISQAPQVTFESPSYVSGPDYASQVVNDPWGMANESDIDRSFNLNSMDFNNGILEMTSNHWDPRLHMNVSGNIDAAKYRYATFRMYLEGEQSVKNGWVQRFLWWYQGSTIDTETTQDMVIYEGWHTYTIDLSQALLESSGSWSGKPTMLRFDPHESSKSETFHLDYLVLTGDEHVPSGSSYNIVFNTAARPGATVTFYYDNDTNPANGRTLIGAYGSQSQPDNQPGSQPSAFSIFLPVILHNSPGELNLISGLNMSWNTTGVAAGTYYISADIDDGVMTTTWYSDVPIILD